MQKQCGFPQLIKEWGLTPFFKWCQTPLFRFEIICLIPLILFISIFTVIPIIHTFIISLLDSQRGIPTLAYYKELFTLEDFKTTLFNTVFIACVSLAIEISLGLILALLLSHKSKSLRFLRPLFILPLAIPTVVVGVIMSYLFATSGWINKIAIDLCLIDSPILWRDGGIISLLMIVFADCWKVTPLVMLILLAGIEAIDRNLYEAARIDGASSFYIFRRITFPLLLPSITIAVIIRGIDAFRIFALPLILMGHNLKVIGTYSYLEYTEYNNQYLSAASSVLLLCIILFAVSLYIKAAGKKGIQAF